MKVISLFSKTLFIGTIYFLAEFNFFLNISKSSNILISENSRYEEQILEKNNYLIDSGDELKIEFVNFIINIQGVPEYTNIYTVKSNGSINLPELGSFKVSGLTLSELTNLLNERYKDFMFEQKINVSIHKYRNVSIYLGGEIKKPGLYVFKPVIQNLNISAQNRKEESLKVKLFEALQRGEGLTTNADLSNIEIIRKNSNSNGGGRIFTTVNLLSLLENGDQSVNIRILDGDYIKVKKSEKVIKEQIRLINKSNLTPNSINTYIIGNVVRPGSTIVKSGANLYEAIASAGGALSQTGRIELLRFRENGEAKKIVLQNKPNSYKTSKNNPEILDGDIITIRRNIIGKTTAALQEISSPILSSYGLYSIFN